MKDSKQMELIPSTSLQEDTLANLSPLQVAKKVKKIRDTSGQSILDLSKNSDRLGLLEKMLVDTLNSVSTPLSRTWRVKTTPLGRLVFQLRASVPTTKEKESGESTQKALKKEISTKHREDEQYTPCNRTSNVENSRRSQWPRAELRGENENETREGNANQHQRSSSPSRSDVANTNESDRLQRGQWNSQREKTGSIIVRATRRERNTE